MVNWPYIWAAFDTAIKAGTVPANFKDDVGWARYPEVTPGQPRKPPLGGINLAISAFTKHPDVAVEAVRCLTSTDSQKANMLESGNPVARAAVYDDPLIIAKFPMEALIKQAIADGGLRAVTPYYGDVSPGIQRTWHPPRSVKPQKTPQESAKLIQDVFQNKRLLRSAARPCVQPRRSQGGSGDGHRRAPGHRHHPASAASARHRPGAARTTPRLVAVCPGDARHAAGHRLSDGQRALPVAVRVPADRPGLPALHRSQQLRRHPHRPH